MIGTHATGQDHDQNCRCESGQEIDLLWSHCNSRSYTQYRGQQSMRLANINVPTLVASGIAPLTTLTTSLSRYLAINSVINELVAGVDSEGLRQTVLPAAIAPA